MLAATGACRGGGARVDCRTGAPQPASTPDATTQPPQRPSPLSNSREPIDLAALAQQFVDPGQDRAIKRGYLRWFQAGARLLDVGCGHGALLAEAGAAGFAARGIDASPAAVAACRTAGLQAELADAAPWLEQAAARGERFDGVALVHVVEHLPPEQVAALLGALAAVLAPGGRLLVATPNARNLIVLEQVFWLDPTHLRPYPRPLLERLAAAAGLSTVASFDDPASRPLRGPLRRLLARLRSLLSGADRSGPMDAVVVFARQ